MILDIQKGIHKSPWDGMDFMGELGVADAGVIGTEKSGWEEVRRG